MKTRKTKEFWEKHFAEFERQNITQSKYCKENNLNANYFSKLLTNHKISKRKETTLVEIKQRGFSNPRNCIFVNLATKYTIKINSGFEESALSRVLDLLEKRL